MWWILMCIICMCISWPCNNYTLFIPFFVIFKLSDFSLSKWSKALSPYVLISRDNPERLYSRYSFRYCVNFSHCRRWNQNWLHVAIHQEKTCNLETLLLEMLTGIGPYVCWRVLSDSSKHSVVVASVVGYTYCYRPAYGKCFSERYSRSILSVCGSICGKFCIKF